MVNWSRVIQTNKLRYAPVEGMDEYTEGKVVEGDRILPPANLEVVEIHATYRCYSG